MLTVEVLWVIFVFYIITLAGLAYLLYRSYHQLSWTIRNVNYYLAARYLPAVIGVLTTTLYLSMTQTLCRMLPFIHMADQISPRSQQERQLSSTICAHYFPVLRVHDTLTRFLMLGKMVTLSTIGFKAILMSVQDNGDGTWLISMRFTPAVLLGFTYLELALTTAYIALTYAKRSTGLKQNWDPTSLADTIVLFATFESKVNLEHDLNSSAWHRRMEMSKTTCRLGYWKIVSSQPSEPSIIYGIGAVEPGDTSIYLHSSNLHLSSRGSLERYCDYLARLQYSPDVQPNPMKSDLAPLVNCCGKYPKCEHYPYQRGPFLVGTIGVMCQLLILTAIIAVLSYAMMQIWTSDGVILNKKTWVIQSNDIVAALNGTRLLIAGELSVPFANYIVYDEAATIRDALALIFLRFLPVALMSFVGTSIASLDVHHRWIQPFVNMFNEASPASETLLLDYMTVSPLSVLPQAWSNSHGKVLVFGVLNAVSWVPPLVATSLCGITETGSKLIVQMSSTSACICVVFAMIYVFALLSSWPSAKRKLPRHVGSLYGIYRLFDQSRLRWDPEFSHAAFSSKLTKDEFHALFRLRRDKYRFGLVTGSGQKRPGFDVAIAHGEDTGYVRWLAPVPRIWERAERVFKRLKGRRSRSPDIQRDLEQDNVSMQDINTSTAIRLYWYLNKAHIGDGLISTLD
jgi:hypothetical protein